MITRGRNIAENLKSETLSPALLSTNTVAGELKPYMRNSQLDEESAEHLFAGLPIHAHEDEALALIPQIERDPVLEEEVELEKYIPLERIIAGMSDWGQSIDPVRLYLREIGRHPLLSAEEEGEAARQIASGKLALEQFTQLANLNLDVCDTLVARFTKALAHIERIFDHEVREKLEHYLLKAQRAHHRLSQSNLRLVVSVAKRYTGSGLNLLDLIQEGSMGLLRAVDKFDYTLGYKFSTYATWWIRQSISRAIADQARLIRLPIHMSEMINRQARTQRRLEQELGREPTFEELAVEMELLSPEDANRVRAVIAKSATLDPDLEHRLQRVTEKLLGMQRLNQEPLSLNAPIRTTENGALGDFIKDERSSDPDDAINHRQLQQEMSESLLGLHERERQVIELRFGLEDGIAHTLEDIAQTFNITRERVRQIEAKALRKLRHPLRSGRLRSYLS